METIHHAKETKAIKQHVCDFCGQKIPKGYTYMKSTHVYDGIYDWKTHKQCSEIAIKLNMYEDCDEGLTGDMFCEIINDYYWYTVLGKFSREDEEKYSEIIAHLSHVEFRYKLGYVIREVNKIKQHEH